jgi:hypothetical protein
MAKKGEETKVDLITVETQAKTLFDRIIDYVTSNEWTYFEVEEDKCVSFGIRLRDANVRLYVNAEESPTWSRILVHCLYPTYVPAARRQAVADAINRVNYTHMLGNLEMDMQDGELRIRTGLESDLPIGEQMVDRAIRKALNLAEQYQAPLLAIAFGNADPADLLAMASRGEDATLQ